MDMYEVHPPAMIAELTGRSVGYIRSVACAMGIRSGGRGKNFDDYWTDAEEKQLDQLLGRVPIRELSRLMGRSPQAIQTKATRLGLGRRRSRVWTEIEDQLIRDEYPAHGVAHCAMKLNRSYHSVKHRARKLGVQWDKKTHPWVIAETKRHAEIRMRNRRKSA